MGFQIEDGVGTGQKCGISPTGNRLNTSARTDERIYYVSRDNGDAYTLTSIDTAAAGEYNLYFKNTSTSQKFYVKEITVGSAVLAIFKVSKVTGNAAGTTITPVNMNFISGNTASATALGNAAVTGLSESAIIEMVSVEADSTEHIDFHDALILGQGDAIAIEYDTGAGGTIHLNMVGFFDVE